MKAYMIVRAVLHDRERFVEEYAKHVVPLMEQYGGIYILRSPNTTVLEGIREQSNSIVISQWPSMEAAKEFWTSEEYGLLKKKREGLADCHVILVESEESFQNA